MGHGVMLLPCQLRLFWSQGTTNSLLVGGGLTSVSVSGIADSGQMAGEGWSSAVTNGVPLYWASPTSTAVTLNNQCTAFGQNLSYAADILMGGDGSMIGTFGPGENSAFYVLGTFSLTGPPSYLWTPYPSDDVNWCFATSKARGHWATGLWFQCEREHMPSFFSFFPF
jgi:hypothetical protein